MRHEQGGFNWRSHDVARTLYWLSMLALIFGAWLMINPTGRPPQDTGHIYVTLVTFELYAWLLVVLGRWQAGKRLVRDVARSGIFALVLVGLTFVAANELYMVSRTHGLVAGVLAAVLALVKLAVATRWFGFRLPAPMAAACAGWVALLAVPPMVFTAMEVGSVEREAAGLICAWAVAALVALHVPLIGWQQRRGWGAADGLVGRWWTPWLISALLGVMAYVQLYAAMWGLFVQFAHWYFVPLYLAAGAVALTLSIAAGRRYVAGAAALAAAVVVSVLTRGDAAPETLTEAWSGVSGYLLHPVYPAVALASVSLLVGALVSRRWWMLGLAALGPLAIGAVEYARLRLSPMQQQGAGLLLAAFALLGIGAAVQRSRERRDSAEPPPAPEPPDPGAGGEPASPDRTPPAPSAGGAQSPQEPGIW